MKKILVALLALALVGGAFAQVTTTLSASGSSYIERNTNGASDPIASLSPNGGGNDVLTFKADKDGKYGVYVEDHNLFGSANLTMDYWNVWYKNDLGFKATFGKLNGASYVQWLPNGWIGTYGPTDPIGSGLLLESTTLGDLQVGLFLPQGGGKMVDTEIEAASIGASYAVKDMVTVNTQVNLGLASGSSTNVNVGFDGSFGVSGLDAYGFVNYNAASSASETFGFGGQFKTAEFRAGAEFEGTNTTTLTFDVVANVRYYVMPTFFVQVRPYFYSKSNGMDGRYAVRAYGNYALGNGLAAEVMAGYDAKPASTASASVIHYVRLTYSVSF